MKAELKVQQIEILQSDSAFKVLLTVPLDLTAEIAKIKGETAKAMDKAKEAIYTATITPYKPKRTLDANSYLWVLTDKIAKTIRSTKEEVYRKAIKEVGIFEILPIKNEAVEQWRLRWGKQGMGWISDIIGESKLKGYTNTINYYGSSVYNRSEMKRLIDYIIDDCIDLEIETITPKEKERMLKSIKE